MYSIITFDISDKEKCDIAFAIRNTVFVEEQKVSREEEYDEHESVARHYLLFSDGIPAGTARMRSTEKGVKLERFAVLPRFRNKGAGAALVSRVLADALASGNTIYLHAQVAAMNLYKRSGFTAEGELFYEAGIPHYKMVYTG
jgi:predicted GNAT family N-acyltransferase